MTNKIYPVRIRSLFQLVFLLIIMPSFAQAGNPDITDISVRVSSGKVKVSALLDSVSRQTHIVFNMNAAAIDYNKILNISETKMPLVALLNRIFEKDIYEWRYESGVIYVRKVSLSATNAEQMDRPADSLIDKVYVRVIDEAGNPVPSASLSVKGNSLRMISGPDGSAEMRSVPLSAQIICTSIGFEPTVLPLNGRSKVVISIRTTTTRINEISVVSNGYQEITKDREVGSFEKIDRKLLNEQTGSFILDRINGVANGVLFNNQTGGTGIVVRGLSTVNMSKDPLIVLDNFEYRGDLSSINPNDIESVSILKDAAATSIWGIRAGNGVIVITTKTGAFNHPLQVHANTNTSITPKLDLFKSKRISAADYISIEEQKFEHGDYDGLENDISRPPVSPVVELLYAKRNGTISPQDADSRIESYRNHDVRNDVEKYLLKQSLGQQYALSMSGGTAQAKYYMSAGYDRNLSSGLSSYERINVNAVNTFRVTRFWDLNCGVRYSQQRNVGSSVDYLSFFPYEALADKNGNPLPVERELRSTYVDTAGGGRLLDWKYYPIEDWKHNVSVQKANEIMFNIGTTIKLFKGLQLQGQYQYRWAQNAGSYLNDEQSYIARSLINTYTQVDPETGELSYGVPLGGIFQTSSGQDASQSFRSQLTYNLDKGRSNLSILAGGEITGDKGVSGARNTFYGYKFQPFTYESLRNDVPYNNYVTGFSDYLPVSVPTAGGTQTLRTVSVYGDASYQYNNKYVIWASTRRDGANVFGFEANKKWKPLWSTGVAWNIKKEGFFKVNWLSELKLRASYGLSGNIDASATSRPVIGYTTGIFTNQPSAVVTTYGNPDLKWEVVGMTNIGIDFSARGERISGSLDFYKKNDRDLYGPKLFAGVAGLEGSQAVSSNFGNMTGKGLDLKINTVNVKGFITWSSRFLLNVSTNRLKKYFENTYLTNLNLVGGGLNPVIDKPLYSMYGFKWGGLDPLNGDPQSYIDGKLSKDYSAILTNLNRDDLVYKGSALPTVFGSLHNSVTFKSLSVDVNLTYSAGYWFKRPSVSYANLYAGIVQSYTFYGSADYYKRWMKPGDESKTDVPSLNYPEVSSERDGVYQYAAPLIDKAANVRLQFIRVAYNLAGSLIKAKKISECNLYFNINNVGILYRANKAGLDPEAPNAYAGPKGYVLGLSMGL